MIYLRKLRKRKLKSKIISRDQFFKSSPDSNFFPTKLAGFVRNSFLKRCYSYAALNTNIIKTINFLQVSEMPGNVRIPLLILLLTKDWGLLEWG